MKQLTIYIHDWKSAGNKKIVRVIRRALQEAQKDKIFDDPQMDSAHYNDYENTGVVVHLQWKNLKTIPKRLQL